MALYLGPESIAPVASVLAGIAGAVLVFWRQVVGGLRRVGARVRGWRRRPG